jgi:hypothetical protein
MSLVTLFFGWIVLTSLGIGAIVAAEPLWTRRQQPVPCRTSRASRR